MDHFITRPAPNAAGCPIDTSPARVSALVKQAQANTKRGPKRGDVATREQVAMMLGTTLNQLNNWCRGRSRGRGVGSSRDRRAPYAVVYCLEALAYSPAATYRTFWGNIGAYTERES